MTKRSKPIAPLPDPFEETVLVLAGPKSRVGYRCPSVRTAINRDAGADGDITLEITTTVELRLVDGMYPGSYVITKLEIAPAVYPAAATPGLLESGIPIERIRRIDFGAQLSWTVSGGGFRLVVVDPETGTVVDHANPFETLSGDDDRLVAYWLSAKLSNYDANKSTAAAMGLSATAVAERIKRLRNAGVLMPAETAGKRR